MNPEQSVPFVRLDPPYLYLFPTKFFAYLTTASPFSYAFTSFELVCTLIVTAADAIATNIITLKITRFILTPDILQF